MRYLLDTNVVSALRVRGRNRPVEAWAASVPLPDQFVTATTVAEIERAVIAKERCDTGQGEILRRWFDEHVLPAFADRVVPLDLPAARILATYRVPEHAPFDDARRRALRADDCRDAEHHALRAPRRAMPESLGHELDCRTLTARQPIPDGVAVGEVVLAGHHVGVRGLDRLPAGLLLLLGRRRTRALAPARDRRARRRRHHTSK